ncbi:xanthine/uracil permease family protein [Melioribacter roseus P3M-2]|uniref:Xanthine/uracil permease family protein n=1 Tax=Melioribacter roseus (strain DSM 23840 / JCM 17771 / VKM B-2668 / P3M-2) TaxID=1191523 RepID=I6ZSB0_MELRP|nr:NCS2 family permease [Melioribacter roseus]AFN74904.1 xanthine/uracil permease family protein [Melioribacter roseus P3M-2]
MSLKMYFNFEQLRTNYRNEIIGGITTFVTMAYIVIVNPKILEAAGIPFGPSMVATVLTAFFGTFIMGVYAKRPFAIAPYMGENAFIAYTVVKVLGYSWQTALGAIFISGVLFTILTLTKIRSWLANEIPEALKISFAVGIGLFLTFIGLNDTGIVSLGAPGAPVKVGNLSDVSILLAVLGFIIIAALMIKKVHGAIIIGILSVAIMGFILGEAPLPQKIIDMPPSIEPIFMKIDWIGALTWGFIAVILVIFITDLIDTLGTLLGLAYKADMLDENGNLPDIEKPMLCDALSTVVASLLGTTTAGVYIESAAGIEAGGRSGFSAVVTALLFLLTLFLSPFFTSVPPFAYGASLIIVGFLMMSPVKNIDFGNLPEAIPAFVTIVMMCFTYNLGVGMTAGFAVYPITMTLGGKFRQISTGMWVLFAFSLLFYVFYPY